MAQTMVNFRMDSDLKASMEKVCKEIGMSMTTAFTIFATKVSREKRIPFEITAAPFYSKENTESLKASAKQLDSGKVVTKTFEDLGALINE